MEDKQYKDLLTKYAELLTKNKYYNIVLHGAPGTGKTYMAREIAAKIIGCNDVEELGEESNKKRFGFVQFHPSYDYTDFVEGLRPTAGGDGKGVSFRLAKGAFMEFVDRAREEEDRKKKEEEDRKKKEEEDRKKKEEEDREKKYVFVIDEINRGDISKVFGELFFSIDPGYRVKEGDPNDPKLGVKTQYANMHDEANKGIDKEEDQFKVSFYITDNVYVIGTMNDIDRSVDSFDYAMRRRFKFIEVKPEDTANAIFKNKGDEAGSSAYLAMQDINKLILNDEKLGSKYQLGATYFAGIKEDDALNAWRYSIKPLISEYLHDAGEDVKKEILEYAAIFAKNMLKSPGDDDIECLVGDEFLQLFPKEKEREAAKDKFKKLCNPTEPCETETSVYDQLVNAAKPEKGNEGSSADTSGNGGSASGE